MTEQPAQDPGEHRPSHARPLERAPGERYAPHRPEDAADQHLDHRGGLLWGAAAAVMVMLIWTVATGVVDLGAGMLVLAALGGWVIGAAVVRGAWGSAAHPPNTRGMALGAGLGLTAWFGGTLLGHVLGVATVPDASTSLAERLAQVPLTDALTQRPLWIAELLVLVVVAARTAR